MLIDEGADIVGAIDHRMQMIVDRGTKLGERIARRFRDCGDAHEKVPDALEADFLKRFFLR